MVSNTLVSQSATPVDMPPTDAPIHPVADIFPRLSDADYAALRTDIEQHGVLQPIWVDLEGRVLDGRHRLRAAHELGITCPTLVHDGPDPIGFVVSLNFRRRNLTASQRGMVAAKIAALRQGRPSKNTPQKCGVSTKQAAEKLDVSTRTVEHAKTVLKHGSPEIIRAVESGKMRVAAAAALASAAKEKRQTIENPNVGSSETIAPAKPQELIGTRKPKRWPKLKGRPALAAHRTESVVRALQREVKRLRIIVAGSLREHAEARRWSHDLGEVATFLRTFARGLRPQ